MFGGSGVGIAPALGACLGGLMMLSLAVKARRMRFGKVGALLLLILALGFFAQAVASFHALAE